MKTSFYYEPRIFTVNGIKLSDMGKIHLETNEMVSLRTSSGRECDITAMNWGFYLGPSLNGRLIEEGFKSALAINTQGRIYLLAVEMDKLNLLYSYLKPQNSKILCWLDAWVEDTAQEFNPNFTR